MTFHDIAMTKNGIPEHDHEAVHEVDKVPPGHLLVGKPDGVVCNKGNREHFS